MTREMTHEEFALKVVETCKLPLTHLGVYTNHNLSVVLTYVQALAVDLDVQKLKALGPATAAKVPSGESSEMSLSRLDLPNTIATISRDMAAGRVVSKPEHLDLAPSMYGGGLVLVPRGSPGSLGAPRELVEASLNIAHADNAARTSETLARRDTGPGQEIKGDKLVVQEGKSSYMNVDHIFVREKLWWAKPTRFETFAGHVFDVLSLADEPGALETALEKIKKRLGGKGTREMAREAVSNVERATAALEGAFETSGLLQLAADKKAEADKPLLEDD